MKALVIGPSGPAGQYVVAELLARGITPRVLALPESLHRLPYRSEVDIVPGMLEDPAALEEAVEGMEIVFHAANIMPPPNRDPDEMMHVNRDGTRRLIQACLGRIRRLVMISTVTVYTPHRTPDMWPVKDDADRLAHGNPQLEAYGQSMIEAEDAVFESHERSGLEFCVLRPTVVCGRNARFAERVVVNLLRSPDRAEGLHRQFGVMQWVHGVDVGRAAILSAESPATANGQFIVAGPKSVTAYDLLAEMWSIINPYDETNPYSRAAQEHAEQLDKFDSGRLRKACGYEPTRSIRQCLEEILGRIEFYTSSGIKLPQRPRLTSYEV